LKNDEIVQKPLKELSDNVVVAEVYNETRKGLPLLQVWPSDSPRADSDEQGQVFVFPDTQENINDSGIESTQVRLLSDTTSLTLNLRASK